jgi:SRSO17 transposase
MEYSNTFSNLFTCHRKNNTEKAYQYLCGLIQAPKRNIERMEEVVEGLEYDLTQHFISGSPWKAQAVMDRVAREADGILGGTADTFLLIDESGFTKKGEESVAVARQYNGRLGKVDNCQVAVFGALCAGKLSTLLDARLFLPDEWVNDLDRCEKAGIPKEMIVAKSKIELAKDIVTHQREIGTRFSCVSVDGLYGDSGEFLRWLDDTGEVFMANVHTDQLVYLSDPKPEVPARSSPQGRKPTKLQACVEPVRVDKIRASLKWRDWRRVAIRESTEGTLKASIYRRTVWLWDGKEGKARKWTLLIRKDGADDIKYAISNAHDDVNMKRFAGMEAQRFWIERSLQDGKSTVGMDEYQVRGWLAWHHHIAMCMMALLFILKQRVIHSEEEPLLSANDIRSLLVFLLPRKNCTFKEVLRQMEIRHAKRQAATDFKANCKKRQHVNIPK